MARRKKKPYLRYGDKHLPACSTCVHDLVCERSDYPEFLFAGDNGFCSVCNAPDADSQIHVSVKPAVKTDGILKYPLVDVYGGVIFP